MPYTFQRDLDFRETDPDAHCGPRGYLELFQATVTRHMALHDLGNDVLPYKYGIGWMFTRYRLRVLAKADTFSPVELTTWVSGKPGRRFMTHEYEVRQKGELMCAGRLECCFFDLERQRVSHPEAVAFPNSLYEEGMTSVGPFRRLDRAAEGALEVFPHTIRYCDIDNNGHMNNLRYVNLVLDAFTRDELEERPVADVEIHYLSQCREGQTVSVWRRDGEGDGGEGRASDIYVKDPAGQVACRARLAF